MRIKSLLPVFLLTLPLFAGGSSQNQFSVTAVVLPKAIIEVTSPGSVTVRVVLNAGATASVWLDSEACGMPGKSRVIHQTGIFPEVFPENELSGKSHICLASSDGVLHASAALR